MSLQGKEKGYSTHKRTSIVKKGTDGEAIYNTYYRNLGKMSQLAAESKKPNEASDTTFVGEAMYKYCFTVKETPVTRPVGEL